MLLVFVLYILLGFFLSSIALGLSGQIHITLNLDLMFYLVKDYSKALSTQPTSVILYNSLQLFLTIVIFFFFLKVVLKGLKQLTRLSVWVDMITLPPHNSNLCTRCN